MKKQTSNNIVIKREEAIKKLQDFIDWYADTKRLNDEHRGYLSYLENSYSAEIYRLKLEIRRLKNEKNG